MQHVAAKKHYKPINNQYLKRIVNLYSSNNGLRGGLVHWGIPHTIT